MLYVLANFMIKYNPTADIFVFTYFAHLEFLVGPSLLNMEGEVFVSLKCTK